MRDTEAFATVSALGMMRCHSTPVTSRFIKECDREVVRDSPAAARVDTWIPVRKPG